MTMSRVNPPRLITTLAERAASHPSMERAVIAAVRDTLPWVIEGVLRDMFPGEQVRLFVPKTDRNARAARDQRIAAALATGERQALVARREGVSLRTVESISARTRKPKP